MKSHEKQLQELQAAYVSAAKTVGVSDKKKRLAELEAQSKAEGFWDNSTEAQLVMKDLSRVQSQVEPWILLDNELKDTHELVALQDESLDSEVATQVKKIQAQFDALKEQLKFTGPYDDHDALLTLSAGAGGTDAQDWTQILLRMYSRWAEQNDHKVVLIEESAGDEAGLKKVTIEVSGPYSYGMLKGEHGVHRLVRLSPFNSDNLRQTSFAKVDVLPKIDSPGELEIDASELKIDVYRAGGHGGQSVNTTDSAVRITHIPSGITVSIQNERSQLQNKETAMTILRSRLAQLQLEQHKDKVSELKGPNQSAEWGNQIRSYVLHPYKQVKDLRTRHETSNAEAVLDGDLNDFITAYLEQNLSS